MVVIAPGARRSPVALCRGCCGEFCDKKLTLSHTASSWDCERLHTTVIIPGGSTDQVRCSRQACNHSPAFRVLWRNPKIHSSDREKVWLSCAEHREFFHGYLSQRGFPVRIEDFEETVS